MPALKKTIFFQPYLIGIYIAIACYAISFCFLLPAIGVFLYFRWVFRVTLFSKHVALWIHYIDSVTTDVCNKILRKVRALYNFFECNMPHTLMFGNAVFKDVQWSVWTENTGRLHTTYGWYSEAKSIFHLTCAVSACNVPTQIYRSFRYFLQSFCRELHNQPKIKIHLNLFASLSVACAVCIIWYSWVHLDLVTNTDSNQTVRSRNPVRHNHGQCLV